MTEHVQILKEIPEDNRLYKIYEELEEEFTEDAGVTVNAFNCFYDHVFFRYHQTHKFDKSTKEDYGKYELFIDEISLIEVHVSMAEDYVLETYYTDPYSGRGIEKRSWDVQDMIDYIENEVQHIADKKRLMKQLEILQNNE